MPRSPSPPNTGLKNMHGLAKHGGQAHIPGAAPVMENGQVSPCGACLHFMRNDSPKSQTGRCLKAADFIFGDRSNVPVGSHDETEHASIRNRLAPISARAPGCKYYVRRHISITPDFGSKNEIPWKLYPPEAAVMERVNTAQFEAEPFDPATVWPPVKERPAPLTEEEKAEKKRLKAAERRAKRAAEKALAESAEDLSQSIAATEGEGTDDAAPVDEDAYPPITDAQHEAIQQAAGVTEQDMQEMDVVSGPAWGVDGGVDTPAEPAPGWRTEREEEQHDPETGEILFSDDAGLPERPQAPMVEEPSAPPADDKSDLRDIPEFLRRSRT